LFISAKTGFAPAKTTALAVAIKVMFGIITSSPALTPDPNKERKIAAVPLLAAIAYLVPINFLKFSSNFFVSGPSDTQPLFITFFLR